MKIFRTKTFKCHYDGEYDESLMMVAVNLTKISLWQHTEGGENDDAVSDYAA